MDRMSAERLLIARVKSVITNPLNDVSYEDIPRIQQIVHDFNQSHGLNMSMRFQILLDKPTTESAAVIPISPADPDSTQKMRQVEIDDMLSAPSVAAQVTSLSKRRDNVAGVRPEPADYIEAFKDRIAETNMLRSVENPETD